MKIKINGKTYNGGLSNWTISEKIGNPTASTIQLEVQAGDIVPQAGDVIQILEDDDSPVFFGLIGIPKSPQYKSFFESKIYTMNCTNGNSVLSRRVVNYSFVNKTITEIAEEMGFRSVHYFSRFFKEKEKLSPNEYRLLKQKSR